MKTNGFNGKSMTTRFTTGVIIAAAALILTPRAHAQAELELISGGVTTTVSAASAPVAYMGSIGGWNVSVDTGTSTGPLAMNLTTVELTSSGTANSIEILFSDTFSSVAGSYTAQAGGTVTSGVTTTFSSYYGSSLLTTANPLTAPLVFSSTPYSGADTGVAPGGTVLTEEALVTGGSLAGSEATFGFALNGVATPTGTMPDGGTTLALLGCAMAGMTLIRSKVRKQN